MNNKEVIHRFAQLNNLTAKPPNGNISCRNNILYSYATPIAALHINERGERLVIITNHGYSMTTSTKHMPSKADFHGVKVVYAISVGKGGGYELCGSPNYSPRNNEWVDSSLLRLTQDIEAELLRIGRARTRQTFDHVECLADSLETLASFFDKPLPEEYTELKSIWDTTSDLNGLKTIQEMTAAAKAKAKAKREDAILKFRDGGPTLAILNGGPTLLRLIKDKTEVETSRGAVVPVQRLDKVWDIACAARQGKEIPKLSMHLGPYTFDTTRVSKAGDIEVGCHKIGFKELERMAKELGFINTLDSSSHVA